MSRRPARCTEADLRRAGKVAQQLGMMVEVLTDGTIRVIPIQARPLAPVEPSLKPGIVL